MRSYLLKAACGLAVALAAFSVPAKQLSPLEVVKLAVNDVVAEMNARQDLYAQNPQALNTMVMDRVVPHFDFGRMTQLALGRYWKDATPAERTEIRDSVIDMMVKNYAQSMFQFRNEPVNLIDEKEAGKNRAIVHLSVTNHSSGKPVSVMLRMEQRDTRWRVIDVVVDGVSMVITYRGVFAEEIGRNGIAGLISSIKSDRLNESVQ